jgi:hypothetical protein
LRFVFAEPQEGARSLLDTKEAFEDLEGLLRRCEEADHSIDVEELERLRASDLWRYLRENDHQRLDALHRGAQAAAWQTPAGRVSPVEVRVVDAHGAKSARRAALTPLTIVVESALRDGAMIKGALLLVGPPGLVALVATPPTPPVVEFYHAGGCGDFPQHVAALHGRSAANGVPLRAVAVLDSDHPCIGVRSAQIEATVARLVQHLPPSCVHVHQQRGIENYIPDVYWREVAAALHPADGVARAISVLLALGAPDRAADEFKGLKQPAKGTAASRPFSAKLAGDRMAAVGEAEREAWAQSLRERDTEGDLQALVALIDSLR